MSIHRRATRRDTNESEIRRALEMAGATAEQLSGEGTPDLLVGFRGQTHLLEVKTLTGKLRASQVAWHGSWAGSPVHVVRTVNEALSAIGIGRPGDA